MNPCRTIFLFQLEITRAFLSRVRSSCRECRDAGRLASPRSVREIFAMIVFSKAAFWRRPVTDLTCRAYVLYNTCYAQRRDASYSAPLLPVYACAASRDHVLFVSLATNRPTDRRDSRKIEKARRSQVNHTKSRFLLTSRRCDESPFTHALPMPCRLALALAPEHTRSE